MAQAVASPDWNLIQALYLKGIPPKQIAAQTGVTANQVSCRANRKGWTVALAQSKPITKVSVTVDREDKDESPKLTAQSERTRTALADVIARSAEKLASHPVHTHKAALRLNQDAESLVRNAKTVFGWSEGQSSPAVRINILGSAVIDSSPAQKPVIEQAPEPAQLPPPKPES